MSNERSSHASGAFGERLSYEPPSAEWHDLRVITLGGTIGSNDSGSPETQECANGPCETGVYDDRADDFSNFV